MHVLVIGSGAREHALLVALSHDPNVTQRSIAPGNGGTNTLAEQYPVNVSQPDEIVNLAQEIHADLVVIGPEVPLVLGVADALQQAGIPCFGPTQAAARIEGSKIFAKEIMAAAGVPTSRSESIDNIALLDAALDRFGPSAGQQAWVVKDDSLAAGKGVVVSPDRATARAHAVELLEAGHRVLLESFLDGPEVSLFSIVDGTTVIPLIAAQDFKRVSDHDQGPNTGGMGAYAPLPWLPENIVKQIVDDIVQPVANEMVKQHSSFSGLLYTGLAMTSQGPAVVEFNCRFGDPETQAVLALLDSPISQLLYGAATGQLANVEKPRWKQGYAVTVVLAAEHYPSTPRLGDIITGADQPEVLHAGTSRTADGALISSGGRVLSIVATGADLTSARQQVYDVLSTIILPGGHFRHDIALAASQGAISLPEACT